MCIAGLYVFWLAGGYVIILHESFVRFVQILSVSWLICSNRNGVILCKLWLARNLTAIHLLSVEMFHSLSKSFDNSNKT